MENQELPKKLTPEEVEQQKKNLEQNNEKTEQSIEKDDSLRVSEIDIEISKKEQNVEETKNKIDDIRNSFRLPPSDETPPSIQSQKDILGKLHQEKLVIETKAQEELREERRMAIIEELKKENANLTDEGKNEIFFDYIGKGKNSIPTRAEKILSERFPEYDGLANGQRKEKVENLDGKENKTDFENFEYPNTMREMYSAGENVLSNPESTENEKIFAQKFIDQLQIEDIESVEDLNKYNEHINQELTGRFKEIIKNGVLLNEQREKLNISELNEKEFDVKVLSLEENFAGDDSEWKKVTGSPSMFVERGKFDGKKIIPTIFISKNMLNQLDVDFTKIENGSSEFYDFKANKKILQHEYRHTQRKFSSENDKLFRLLDEACTNVGSLYGKLQGLLDCLGMTTNDFDMPKIKEAYETDSDDGKALILRQIKDNFSEMGLLLIGSKSSSEHTNDREGITDLPLVEIDEDTLEDKNYDYTDSKFLETLLALRSKNDKNWADTLKNNLKNEKISLGYLEDVLQNYYLMPYKKLKDNPNCPNLNTFFEIFSSEIKQRKASSAALNTTETHI